MFNVNFDINHQPTDIPVAISLELDRLQKKIHHLENQVQELQKASCRDSLTQLTNRHYFNTYLEQQWQKLACDQLSLSLIFCEIDCFNIYNQSQGDEAGEQCIQEVAIAITESIYGCGSLVSRYETEQFAVILPRLQMIAALKVAQRIRTKVKKLALLHHPKIDGLPARVVTVSLGVASTIPKVESLPSNLVLAGEQALYKSTRTGRDRANCISIIL